jgi:hypothetical protein
LAPLQLITELFGSCSCEHASLDLQYEWKDTHVGEIEKSPPSIILSCILAKECGGVHIKYLLNLHNARTLSKFDTRFTDKGRKLT